MDMSKGKLIVIEGLDGSGKGTQAAELAKNLAAGGAPVRKVSFPDYASDSSALVKMYLSGQFGKLLSSTIFWDGLYFLMIFVYYKNRVSIGWGPRPFGRGPIKRARRMQAMATGAAALLAGNRQENSGCALAFFRIFRGKCSHLGLCGGSSVSSQTK